MHLTQVIATGCGLLVELTPTGGSRWSEVHRPIISDLRESRRPQKGSNFPAKENNPHELRTAIFDILKES